MKKKLFFLISIIFIVSHLSGYAQHHVHSIDLIKLEKEKKITVYNRKLSVINKPGFNGIKLEEHPDDGIAWITSLNFSYGTVEFDMKGIHATN